MAYMPCIPLAVKLPETADLRQAARYLGAPGEPDEQTLALLRRCAPPLMAACRARAVYRQLSTADLAQTGLLQGQDIARHLAGCTGGVLLAVTLGRVRMEPSAGRASEMWPPGAGTDALASALAEQAADAAERLLVQHYQGQGLYLTGRYSPGYGDWPLAVQPLPGQTAGYAPADRPLRAGKLPDDPPQKHHRPFGRGRTSGAGAPCRMRPLCFAGAL